MAYSPKHGIEKKNNKALKTAGVVLGVLVVAAAALLVFKSCSSEPDAVKPQSLLYDSNASEGGWNKADTEAIIESLNEKVEAGMINISMNTSPVFEDGTSEGNLMIVNDTSNLYPQIVEISLNDTGETIYKSGGIPVGSKIERAKLNKDLPAGTYECTAMFHNVDPATGESLGCAGAVITVNVLN